MSAPVFAAPTGPLEVGTAVHLGGPEGHHAATVRRLRVGERLLLADGRGRLAGGEVMQVRKDSLLVAVHQVVDVPEPQPRLVVVQALPKGDRGQVAVETLTEVGVDVVVPWAAARCVTHWRDERGAKALARWRSTAREAAKQSRRAWWPEVAPLASTDEVAALLSRAALALLLHEEAHRGLATVPPPTSGDVVLVVGPEGGVDPDELATLTAAGAVAVHVGPTVLRTSTAGTIAAAALLARTPRWA